MDSKISLRNSFIEKCKGITKYVIKPNKKLTFKDIFVGNVVLKNLLISGKLLVLSIDEITSNNLIGFSNKDVKELMKDLFSEFKSEAEQISKFNAIKFTNEVFSKLQNNLHETSSVDDPKIISFILKNITDVFINNTRILENYGIKPKADVSENMIDDEMDLLNRIDERSSD